ncbi:hypothetical protein C439_10520 [Haloferax mediterranei ATCC 33500]|nr:hypothetical protein BM92_09440 [Haloferax mediterranei ATCC 33500]EMA03011.1 hypothetical protein C439_10520 [Haloferax mediterranei ATCC 33500]
MELLNRLRDHLEQEREETASTPISTDDAYAVLANERRRRIIEYLVTNDTGDPIEVRAIVAHLVELGEDRNAAYASALQSHCPKLAESQLVEYDGRSKAVLVLPSLHRLYDAHDAFTGELG